MSYSKVPDSPPQEYERIEERVEDELTILEIDKEEFIKKLRKLGAKRIFDAEIEDYYFDTENEDLEKHGARVRIRKITESGLSNLLKRPWYRVDIKTDHRKENGNTFEYNSFVERTNRFGSFRKALAALRADIKELKAKKGKKWSWFRIRIRDCMVRNRKKERVSYLLGGVKFDFDTFLSQRNGWCSQKDLPRLRNCDQEDLSFVPTFVEVEIVYPKDSSEQRRLSANRRELLTKLGVSEDRWRSDDFDRVQIYRK